MISARHRYLAQRLPKERAQAQRAASERREHEQGRSEGYSRARDEFTELLVAEPGSRVVVKPPERPFLDVVLPCDDRRVFARRSAFEPSLRETIGYKVARFEFREMRIAVEVGHPLGPQIVSWWVPELLEVR